MSPAITYLPSRNSKVTIITLMLMDESDEGTQLFSFDLILNPSPGSLARNLLVARSTIKLVDPYPKGC